MHSFDMYVAAKYILIMLPQTQIVLSSFVDCFQVSYFAVKYRMISSFNTTSSIFPYGCALIIRLNKKKTGSFLLYKDSLHLLRPLNDDRALPGTLSLAKFG
jgi:hypothetical protein